MTDDLSRSGDPQSTLKDALSTLARRTKLPVISWLMHSALTRPGLISLAAGFTDNPALPVEISRRLLNEILSSPKTGQPALQYGITAGETNLRKLTAEHLRKLDLASVAAPRAGGRRIPAAVHSPDRLIITGGSQQLLYMTLEALCDEGDIVLVEDPTYFVFLSILQSRGIGARGVKLERDGISPEHFEEVLRRLKKSGELRRVKAIYLVTYFQNPTGATTSFRRKWGILARLREAERAAGHPIYLIEDSAYRELRFSGGDTPSALMVPGAAGRVIHTGTFSKPFATGARVGYGILPEPVYTAVLRIKGNHDFGTANLLQQLLARALETGLYRRHVAKIERRYREKAQAMKQAMAEHFPSSVEIWEPGGGLYFWARLPEAISTGIGSRVFQSALKKGVLYVPGGICYAEDPSRRQPDHEMRISYGNASEDDIRRGIRRLGAVLRRVCG